MFDLVPFKRNNAMKREDYFNKFFDNFFNDDFFSSKAIMRNPFKVDVKETTSDYTIEAELPGIDKNNISIEYKNSYLTISAKKEDKVEDKTSNYVSREISYGEFKRSFYVDNVCEKEIKAEFLNGVLNVVIPKKKTESPEVTKIEIQ
ncbi:heat shock protein Hsp18 [Haloimpatiens sp. FM7315]|uniref:heat shock protein Hsp18 n=1 Tax=Haloimpatiens sp. FM7315 TaxID=3298609 RepID=UPI0035A30C8E